jgi:hypothetical protein
MKNTRSVLSTFNGRGFRVVKVQDKVSRSNKRYYSRPNFEKGNLQLLEKSLRRKEEAPKKKDATCKQSGPASK